MVTKWKSSAPASAESEYFLLLSYLPLKRFRAIPRFLKYTFRVERQLRQSTGLMGYSLQAELLSKKFWTLSAWQDEKALMTFVRRAPHDKIMKQLAAIWVGPGSLDGRKREAEFHRAGVTPKRACDNQSGAGPSVMGKVWFCLTTP